MTNVPAAKGGGIRILAIAMALSSTLPAAPALARDRAFYIGGEVGVTSVSDMDIDIGAVDDAVSVNHGYGYDAGIFVGYDFGAFRLEAEASQRRASLDSYTTTIRLPSDPPVFPTQGDAHGNSRALGLMVNGMLDIGDDEGISGFAGVGVGMARVEAVNYRNNPNASPFLDDGTWKLAWQVFGGARLPLSGHLDLTLKYRFFNAERTDFTAFNGGESGTRFRSHSLLTGLTFNF
jgi:opacity protein-like surface antigen